MDYPRAASRNAQLPGHVQTDLLFNLPVGQIVQELWFDAAHHSESVEEQKYNFEQYQRISGGTTIVRAVAATDQLAPKAKIHC